jgi:hypothetical protein
VSIKAPSHDLIARMADDVRQLTEPIHTAIRGRVHTHDPLLDQLREAAVPGGAIPGEHRRSIPGSRPPVRLDPVGILAEIYVEISGWHSRLKLASPPRYVYGCEHTSCHLVELSRGHRGPACRRSSIKDVDWQFAVLRQLVGAAPALAPSIADWLAVEVNNWWRDAALGSGWRPADLIKLR